MEIIYLLIPLSLVLVAVAIWAFAWASKSGQFDDLDSPGLSILDDDPDQSDVNSSGSVEHELENSAVKRPDGQTKK